MQGVGQGTLLGGRYALHHRLSEHRELERWSAHDTTLLREVTLTVVGSAHPNRAGVLDAARRAAGVEDTRLVRILDVGTERENSFIVEETMNGSESLATILLQGPLPAQEARRVAGETAKGLETAGRRGLHHLRLTPHHVMIASDGMVRLSGVAVAGAIDGPDEQGMDAATASRRDSVSLVAVLYAALTSRWPLDEVVPGVGAAPRITEGVVAPAEIATGVPEDLDALCRRTLNDAAGPLSPADFAHQIAPWPRERIDRAGVDATVVLRLPPASDETENLEDTGAGAEVAQAMAAPQEAPPARSGPPVGAGTQQTVAISTHNAPSPALAGGPPGGALPDAKIGPPLRLLPASTALPPSGGQSKVVVLVVALFVGLALFVGYKGLGGIGGNPGPPRQAATRAVKAPRVTAPSSPAPRKARAAAPTAPIAILSATGFDPQGDDREGNSSAPRVYDGDLSTSWSSELYVTDDFGNLKKGLGVLLDLGQPTSVHQVTIDLGKGPVDVTAYAATQASLQGATVIGKASGASDRVQLQTGLATPPAQFVIVWFTKLAPDSGQFRASISEIALS